MSGGFIVQAVHRTLQARRVEIQLAKLALQEENDWEIAAIPDHPWLKFNGSDKMLDILLDFAAARHWAMANVVYELNKFRQLDSVRVSMSVQRVYWEQVKPVSAIYGLDHPHWTFAIVENGAENAVEIGSDVDCYGSFGVKDASTHTLPLAFAMIIAG
ncbi:uncharacterized protein EAF02_009494 [Botrytis sinoallii]|uniref:uncharacterized protein n=1 Tax=Botrytis sinoallii TaxID=1463999 RepID=UPI0019020E69|nr:uncharacterized protein EAF02_009494 [Botrytis sinoallii]KAF7868758.1 hypothetical protein EAF02_009494 [Botrytis sinoallii]